jgi:hypothetical protein
VEDRLRRPKPRLGPGSSVEVDWAGCLPAAQSNLFQSHSNELEVSFGMFSVSLDEAVGLHKSGYVAKSFEVLPLVSSLCERLTRHLQDMLGAVEAHVKKYGTTPSVAGLRPADYRSRRGLRGALADMLSNGTRSQKARFIGKVHEVSLMVGDIGWSVCAIAQDLAVDGMILPSEAQWLEMSNGYFDLNTCLRESLVMLKCFLRVLPDDEVIRFAASVRDQKKIPSTAGLRRISDCKRLRCAPAR